MYILKNAWTSITRNKGRNILMGIIIMVIACATAVSLAIITSANQLVKSYENKYDITATIGINRQKMMENFKPDDESSKEQMKENFNAIESITIDDIEKYGDSQYVKNYYYTYSVGLNSSTIEKATSDSSNHGDMDKPKDMQNSADFNLVGYSSYEAMSEFIEGTYSMKEGTISSDFESNTCIINSELATYNNLSVGDTITLVNPNDSTKTYTLEITGIFSDNEQNGMNMFSNSTNSIITNTTVVTNILNDNTDLTGNINPTFVLTSKDVIEKYEAELQEEGLNENYSVTTNLDEINNETESIQNVSNFAQTFLIITLIIGGVVLLILNMINVRERKYEIGVLRTIGMKKKTVIQQFVLELLIVSIISLSLGGILGSIISVPTANNLLKSEIETASNQQEQIKENFGEKKDDNKKITQPMNGVNKIEYVSEINAVVDIKILLELLAIGILLTVLSSLTAMISIARFSPLTILKERS